MAHCFIFKQFLRMCIGIFSPFSGIMKNLLRKAYPTLNEMTAGCYTVPVSDS